jgi:hypothetical protein
MPDGNEASRTNRSADLRCLTGRQPWWWAILHAGKRIENRRTRWKYRGPILLHAAKGCTKEEYYGAIRSMLDIGACPHPILSKDALCIEADCHLSSGFLGDAVKHGLGPHRAHSNITPLHEMSRSGIVGHAEILGVIEPHTAPKAIELQWPGVDPRWHMPEQYGYVLGDVTPMSFVPCDGMLGLYRPTKALVDKIACMNGSGWQWVVDAWQAAEAAGVVFQPGKRDAMLAEVDAMKGRA